MTPRYRPVRALVAAWALRAAACGAWAADTSQAADAPQPAGAALAQDKGCLRCHAVARHFVGPAFIQVAERYRDDAGAAERLAGRIRQGSVGEWGRVIMPRQPQVTAADAATLAAWVLAQRPAR
ncbi:c-type cytochrome [Acidovorax sp. FG27]|uniref:c-type cytochrome n=1 Tax=Acidovorax sp. FG27 TaxID=3133652 RepID=UPI0030EAE791